VIAQAGATPTASPPKLKTASSKASVTANNELLGLGLLAWLGW
jgi:hypothetical protein